MTGRGALENTLLFVHQRKDPSFKKNIEIKDLHIQDSPKLMRSKREHTHTLHVCKWSYWRTVRSAYAIFVQLCAEYSLHILHGYVRMYVYLMVLFCMVT